LKRGANRGENQFGEVNNEGLFWGAPTTNPKMESRKGGATRGRKTAFCGEITSREMRGKEGTLSLKKKKVLPNKEGATPGLRGPAPRKNP